MVGCNGWNGSSFSLFLDGCFPVCPQKWAFFYKKCIIGHFGPIWWPPCVTPWPLILIFLTCINAFSYWPLVSVHIMSIFGLFTVPIVTFDMKIAILTILTSLVTPMHDPMTPRYISLVLMGCNELYGSSFSPFLDDCLPVCPRKWAFFHEKCIFGHFATFGDLHVRPHDPSY